MHFAGVALPGVALPGVAGFAAAPRASRAGLPFCGSGPDSVWQGLLPENPPDKWLTLPIMVLENSKLVKMIVSFIAPWLPMRLSGNTLLLKLFPKN